MSTPEFGAVYESVEDDESRVVVTEGWPPMERDPSWIMVFPLRIGDVLSIETYDRDAVEPGTFFTIWVDELTAKSKWRRCEEVE